MGNISNVLINLLNSTAAGIEGLGAPVNTSFWGTIGTWLLNVAVWLGNLLMLLVYTVTSWILNIVDFMQYFVKKLMGLDYWGTDRVSPETLGESDIIFKFLYNDTVQRVFRYIIGVAIVLIILFTIYAIIKNEYSTTAGNDKATNEPMAVIKRTLKALVLQMRF